MKSLFPVLLFFISLFCANSQEIDENMKQKLNKLNLTTQNLDLTDLQIQKDLHQILNLEKKRKTNKTLGIVFTSEAIICVVFGSVFLTKENPTTKVVGGILLTGGAVYSGISIPFWNASKKRKKERDKLMELF